MVRDKEHTSGGPGGLEACLCRSCVGRKHSIQTFNTFSALTNHAIEFADGNQCTCVFRARVLKGKVQFEELLFRNDQLPEHSDSDQDGDTNHAKDFVERDDILFLEKLAGWASECQIPHVAISLLLGILRDRFKFLQRIRGHSLTLSESVM